MGGDRAGRAAAVIGFCLAAGAGSRLLPLTRVTPKPLLAPAGRPLVDLAVEALQRAGATRVVVNAHHGADLLVAQLAGRPEVEVVVEPVLLGTGGGGFTPGTTYASLSEEQIKTHARSSAWAKARRSRSTAG